MAGSFQAKHERRIFNSWGLHFRRVPALAGWPLYGHFSGFWRKTGLIEGNPASLVHFPKLGPQLPKSLLPLQIESLLAQPDPSKPLGQRDKAMFELLYACGLRVSEFAGLQLRQVVLEPGYLTVQGKGEKERLVPMGEFAAECLKSLSGERTP